MKNNILKYYIVATFLCSTFMAFAQGPGSDAPGGLESTDAPATPIDGSLWILALVALFFVCMKFRVIYKNRIQG